MSNAVISQPIPVHLFTGPLGVGKTTALGRLLANKPADESWLVVINEFTDTGVDALTLAMQAHGAYNLALIPGGCLCCTGEADFRQQLAMVLAGDPAAWPKRIVIEQSGIAHPGAVVEVLRLFERSGALRLMSTVALLDWARIAEPGQMDELTRALVTIADVLVLAKADQLTEVQRTQFFTWAETLFPAKRWVGASEHGVLPLQALTPSRAQFEFERPVLRPAPHHAAHEHTPQRVAHETTWAGVRVTRTDYALLERHACGWQVSADLLFDIDQLQAGIEHLSHATDVERFKAVVRTDIEHWQLLQCWTDQHGQHWSRESMAAAQESRLEVQLVVAATPHWPDWDAMLARCVSRCPIG